MRGVQRGDLAVVRHDRGERGAARQNQVTQVVLLDEPAACLVVRGVLDAEHAAQEQQLFVVDLEHVGVAKHLFDEFLRIHVTAQVDVEEAQRLGLGVLEQLDDRLMRLGGAQRERAEAHGVGLLHDVDELVRVQDVVPCHVRHDRVFRNAVAQRDFHGAGGPRVALQHRVDASLFGGHRELVAELVLAHGAD